MMQEKSSGKPFFRKAVGMMLAAGLLAVPLSFAPAALPSEMVTMAEASSYVDSGDVVLVGTFQQQFGADDNWAPWDGTTIMHRSGSHKYVYRGWLPKGYYEYKIAIGGSWDENYGSNGEQNGSNMTLNLDHDANVKFTYDSWTHKTTVSYSKRRSSDNDDRDRVLGGIADIFGW